MLENNTKVLVINRGSCGISYEVPELMVSRTFRPFGSTGDRMLVSTNELQLLAYTSGGKRLLDDYLMINETSIAESLGVPVEVEYNYGLDDVKRLLTTCSEEELLDCLDFAPQGVLDLLKKMAVEMRLDSANKRKIISDKLKINLDAMIKNDILVKTAEIAEKAQVAQPVATRQNPALTNVAPKVEMPVETKPKTRRAKATTK